MSLKTEILPYVDKNHLVAPHLADPTLQGSDNGPMYTSEYFVMLSKLGQLLELDKADYSLRIGSCVNPQGMLCRVPIGQEDGQEQVDDYYGVLNGCKTLGDTEIPRKFLWAMIRNLGFMDNENPGHIGTWVSWMPRQLQLVCAMVTAAFPSRWNPIHIAIRLICLPLYLYAAVIIGTACMSTDTGNTDARRLSWHLLQTVKGSSVLCWLASLVWYKRLYKDYGSTGMKAVAHIYYKDSHPFERYWVD